MRPANEKQCLIGGDREQDSTELHAEPSRSRSAREPSSASSSTRNAPSHSRKNSHGLTRGPLTRVISDKPVVIPYGIRQRRGDLIVYCVNVRVC